MNLSDPFVAPECQELHIDQSLCKQYTNHSTKFDTIQNTRIHRRYVIGGLIYVVNSVVLVHKNLFSNSYSYLNDVRIRISVFIVCSHFLNVSYSYSFCLEMPLVLVTVIVIVLVTVMMCVLNVYSTTIMSYIHSS